MLFQSALNFVCPSIHVVDNSIHMIHPASKTTGVEVDNHGHREKNHDEHPKRDRLE